MEGDLPSKAKIVMTPLGLRVIGGKLSYEEWQRYIFAWKKGKSIFHMGLCDLIQYGKDEFGVEKVDETLEAYDFDMADVLKAHAIGQLPLDLRESSLNGEHYYVLARQLGGLTKEQGKWAAIAKKETLTPIELKRSIEKGTVVKQADIERESGQNSGVPNIEGLAMTFQRWVKQAGGEEKILEQPNDWKERFLREIEPIRMLAEKVEGTLPEIAETGAVGPAPVTSDAPGGDNVPATEPQPA